jgi:hypothetical protein
VKPAGSLVRLINMKTAVAVTAAVLVSALAAGCGSVRAPGQPAAAGSRPAPVTAGPPTAAGNRKLAAAQAARLMSLESVPPGAKALSKPPASLDMPGVGLPGVPAQIDTSRSWRLAMTFSQALAWLQGHRPRGLAPGGSWKKTTAGKVTTTGYYYGGQSSPAWQSAELEVEVAGAADGTSVLRADAIVVWLDPVPDPDSSTGRRVHLSVTANCPATDRSIGGVTNSGADLRQRLLPSGAPTAGLECRYYGLNGRPFGLRSQTRLTAAAASQVGGSMQRLPLSHTVGGVATSCPAADGAAEIIVLSYAGRPAVDLWDTLNGCAYVANGFIMTALS